MKKILYMMASLALAGCLTAGVALTAAAAPNTYDNYINVQTAKSGLMIEPTLIVEPQDGASLQGATSVIVTPDAEMEVELGGKRSLARAFDLNLKGKYIPIVRLTKETVTPFLDWLKNTYVISDIMALSDDISVLETLYADEKGYLVNTVYDLTEKTLSGDRYAEWDHIAAANKAGCNILMYSGKEENLAVAAEYVSAMSKVCWAKVESEEEGVKAIAAGCYGIVAPTTDLLKKSVGHFKESGYARAQYVAAHRGITAYANEQSLTGIMASYNEGATHVEIDVQITSDRQILICHDSEIRNVTGQSGKYFVDYTAAQMRKFKLNNYSTRYEDTFASLDEVCEAMRKTDVILIIELKLDSGSPRAVDELKAIETLRDTMNKYPEMKGHWITITFYAPYAQGMREFLPEIPVCYLGGAQSTKENQEGVNGWSYAGGHVAMSNIGQKIAFLRKCNIGLDESMGAITNSTAQNYLARGYVQNTWTFEDLTHFKYKANIATSNAAEYCAMLVKKVAVGDISLTEAELASGEAKVPCETYNGWHTEETCKIIEISRSADTAQVLFYLKQNSGEKANVDFGLYSELKTVRIG